MAMSKCRTIGLPNHRSAEPFKFCFAEENNIPKNTDTNLELNALRYNGRISFCRNKLKCTFYEC